MPFGPQPLAFVITGLEPGGAERALTQLALRINREKFQPFVFSLQPRPHATKGVLVEELTAAGIAVEFLNCRSKWQFTSAVWQLSRRLKALRPAIVQSFLFHANVVAALAGRLCNTKVVAGIRVADPSRARQRVERWISPLVQKFVCVSQSVADYSATTARLPINKLHVIPNGVDAARFRDALPADRAALGLPPNRRFLIAVGRLDPQKGQDWLLPQLPQVFDARPDYDLLLVGDGPERVRLQSQANALNLQGRVHFLGWQPDVPGLLKLADLLLLPSRWEGMPNVLLEAMAAGLPFVSTEVEGAVEIAGISEFSQIVSKESTEQFTAQMLALTGEPKTREKLGKWNQERAVGQFSLAVIASAYEELYCQIINS